MGIWLLGIHEGFFFRGGGGGGRIFLYNFTCSWCRLDYSYIVKILRTWIELFKFQVTLETLISNLLGFFSHEHGIQTRSTSIWIKIRVSLLISKFIVNTKKKPTNYWFHMHRVCIRSSISSKWSIILMLSFLANAKALAGDSWHVDRREEGKLQQNTQNKRTASNIPVILEGIEYKILFTMT